MAKYLYPILFLFLVSCSINKDVADTAPVNYISLDTISITPQESKPYKSSETHYFDLIHTKLEVGFDYEKQYLNGRATLTIKPWFYPSNKLVLDAKGFDIHLVALKYNEDVVELKYDYDGAKLTVDLNNEYTRKDTLNIYVEYTSKPNKLKKGGSAAITSDKGLYFINPLGEDEKKPIQIWTQGETEASSCWFPTIDVPNERMTQEIYITVKNEYLSLSNGELVFQTENGDGTRTDYWKMDLPHAPYLAMMAVGDFSVIKDSWRDSIDVNYFVEHEYAPYAQSIFGLTPEMMECFSEKLGVAYPWNKYHQIVVRDYVSGAMENTTAVIHGEFLHQTDREMLDGNNEDIISHELFHHWFGDLVTCESWANLPLNESFATYGEYIWKEHKYGREAGDELLQDMLRSYLNESQYAQQDMIRFQYTDKEDMFDSHSYSKGGCILHMLRKTVGDDAFYASLQHYLTKHAYQSVEIHDLRIAFEEITGQDLNWFFNQWFLSSGHPQLLIKYVYDDSLKIQRVIIDQKQQRIETPIYQMPVAVDIYANGGAKRHYITITDAHQEFEFSQAEKPLLVNFDAEKMLLCEKTDVRSSKEWAYQYLNAPLYLDRYEAIQQLSKNARKDSSSAQVLLLALNDNNWKIKTLAMDNTEALIPVYEKILENKLIEIASTDSNALVRARAITILSENYSSDVLKTLYINSISDSSYSVIREALIGLANIDSDEALAHCKRLENENNTRLLESICYVYSSYGDDDNAAFFVEASKRINGFTLISFINDYEFYLSGNRSLKVVSEGVDIITHLGLSDEGKYISIFARQALENLEALFKEKEHELNKSLAKTLQNDTNTSISNDLGLQLEQTTTLRKKITAAHNQLQGKLE